VTNVVNLATSKTVGSSTVAVGTTTSFTLVVSNAGPGTLSGSLSDTIPSQLTTTGARISSAVNGSASTASFGLSGSTFAGSVTIASGGTVTVTIEVTAVSAGSYTNTLTVLVPAGTTNLGSTTATAPGTVTNVVNLATSKTVGSSTVAVGTTTSFTLVVSNAGPGTLSGSLSDTIPSQLTTTGARISSAVNGSASTASFGLSGSTFAGSVTIASGGTVTVTIEVTAVSAGSYTNTLTVLVPAGTTNLGSTTATAPGTVTNVVNLATSKTVGSSTVAVGTTTSFTLVVSNAGPGTLSGSLSDTIPSQLTTTGARISSAVNGSASTASFGVSGSGAFAGSVTIASGGTVTVTIEVTAISTGTYTNTLTVLVPATTINLGATQSAVAARWSTWSTSRRASWWAADRGPGPDHQLHAGGEQRRTGHADRQPQRQHPGELQHHAGAGGQRGQRQRQHRQLQRLERQHICRQRDDCLGRHGHGDHRSDGDQHRQLHQHPDGAGAGRHHQPGQHDVPRRLAR
jgi:uncharacterized repeat protein (TIGR01451 family)